MSEHHFWRSSEYVSKVKIMLCLDDPQRLAKLDDGRIVEYHWITNSPDDHKSGWNDAEYLGSGTVYSIDGVLQ